MRQVIRHIVSLTDIKIDIRDKNRNVSRFKKEDIPDIIKQLQIAIDENDIIDEIKCVGVIPDLPVMPERNTN